VTKSFLLIYERPKTRLLRMVEFADRGAALDARFAAEREFRGNPDIEVVVLSAESEQEIRQSHARYFQRDGQLMKNLLRLAEAQVRPAL
jgi:hypothetical protein